MLLPTVTAFSKGEAIGRYADCARVIGFTEDKTPDAKAADLLVEGLYAMNAQLDVPSLSGFGIDHAAYSEATAQMAEDAVRSGAPANNPRVGSVEEITDLFHEAWG